MNAARPARHATSRIVSIDQRVELHAAGRRLEGGVHVGVVAGRAPRGSRRCRTDRRSAPRRPAACSALRPGRRPHQRRHRVPGPDERVAHRARRYIPSHRSGNTRIANRLLPPRRAPARGTQLSRISYRLKNGIRRASRHASRLLRRPRRHPRHAFSSMTTGFARARGRMPTCTRRPHAVAARARTRSASAATTR